MCLTAFDKTESQFRTEGKEGELLLANDAALNHHILFTSGAYTKFETYGNILIKSRILKILDYTFLIITQSDELFSKF